jgi:UDP-N-acetylmuramoyl-L-alanyl-D-glutamate--2,6-diaminopimelate ligase
VINVDDSFGAGLAAKSKVSVVPFARSDAAGLEITPTSHSYEWNGRRILVNLGGSINVMNSLAAASTARAIGIGLDAIVHGLGSAPAVPGRFEKVDAGQDFAVLVDYAHTPDGLAEALRSVREANPSGRLIVVFGCGGDRDKAKRPLMGETAAALADGVVVTSDNPRSEDPQAIIESIVAGIPDHLRQRLIGVMPDRGEAIRAAIARAESGDVVLIAGKGHETTQSISGHVAPFDDRIVAREALEARS